MPDTKDYNGEKQLRTLGRHAKVTFDDVDVKNVKAKIDTGADSSSVWASNLSIDEKGKLHFTLFDKGSPYYTGKEIVKDHYQVKMVRSSNGQKQIRYSVKLRIMIDGWKFLATFTLADRSKNLFPILIGCRLLKNKFVVDVSRSIIEGVRKQKGQSLTDMSKTNPQEFFEKYYKQQTTHPRKEQS